MAKNNQKNKKNNNKKIEIKLIDSKFDAIVLIILVLIIVLSFISPRVYSVTTARYNKGSKKDNINVKKALGNDNTEERFKNYFQWYNVIHELGHGVLEYNSDIKLGNAEEEQLVNDFAVAYWMRYGESERLSLLKETVDYATTHIDGVDFSKVDYIEYANKNWNKWKFKSFNGYGLFQFTSTKKAIENQKNLTQVLEEMGIKDFKLEDKKYLEYPEINEEVSTEIINDAVENIRNWGLEFPDARQHFSNDPNKNFSSPRKKVFGIFEFPDFSLLL